MPRRQRILHGGARRTPGLLHLLPHERPSRGRELGAKPDWHRAPGNLADPGLDQSCSGLGPPRTTSSTVNRSPTTSHAGRIFFSMRSPISES